MSRKAISILLTAMLLPLSACGVLNRNDKKKDKSSNSSNSALGNTDQGTTGQGDNPTQPGSAQSFDINKTVYYSGMKLTFGKLIYDPAKEYPEAPLTIDTTVENIAPTGVQGSPAFTVKVDDAFVEGSFNNDFQTVPSGETGKTTIDFKLPDRRPLGDLANGVLQVGDSKSVRAEAPLGSTGELIDLAPKVIFDKTVVKNTKQGKIWFHKCSLQADLPSDHDQVEQNMRTIVCYVDMQDTGNRHAGEAVDHGNFMVRVPDGSVVAADEAPIYAFYNGAKKSDQEVVFKIRWPEGGTPGDYTFEIRFGNGTAKVPMKIVA
jgi:hypothetical protein